MTAVLCYGDSNTWGYEASTAERLGRWDRWPGVLQRELGDDVHVIEEGQNGRTTVFDVPFEPHRNGLTHLPVALPTHHPLDVVVIDLGTNDLFLPGVNAYHAAHGAMKLAEVVLRATPARRTAPRRCWCSSLPRSLRSNAWGQDESPGAEARIAAPEPGVRRRGGRVARGGRHRRSRCWICATTSRRARSTGSTSRRTDHRAIGMAVAATAARDAQPLTGVRRTVQPIDQVRLRLQRPPGTCFHTVIPRCSATPRDGALSGRISEITWSTGSVAKTQSRHASAASVAIPCRARAGVIDHPELHLVDAVDVLQDRTDVPQELPRRSILHRQQREAVALARARASSRSTRATPPG